MSPHRRSRTRPPVASSVSIRGWTPSFWLQPAGYTGEVPREGESGSNGLALDAEGRLVLAQHGDRRIAPMNAPWDAPEPNFETLAGGYQGQRFNSPNGVAARSNGDLYFTDPPYGVQGVAGSNPAVPTRHKACAGGQIRDWGSPRGGLPRLLCVPIVCRLNGPGAHGRLGGSRALLAVARLVAQQNRRSARYLTWECKLEKQEADSKGGWVNRCVNVLGGVPPLVE